MNIKELEKLVSQGKAEITGEFGDQWGGRIIDYRDKRLRARIVHHDGLPGTLKIPPPKEPIGERVKEGLRGILGR